MNADEIREMDAGRPMDAKVAEKVMGWEWQSYWAQHANFREPVTCKELSGLMGPGGIREVNQYPHYSTDIAAAWEVVEKLATIDGPVSVAWGIYGSEGNKASVMSMFAPGPGAVAPTAPLAICRAALLVVMEVES